jgi:hypothetical protein
MPSFARDVQRGSIPGAPNAALVIRRVEANIAEGLSLVDKATALLLQAFPE